MINIRGTEEMTGLVGRAGKEVMINRLGREGMTGNAEGRR